MVRTVFMDWKGTEEKFDISAYSSQVRGTRGFEMELEDPVLKRSMTHAYDIVTLPVIT